MENQEKIRGHQEFGVSPYHSFKKKYNTYFIPKADLQKSRMEWVCPLIILELSDQSESNKHVQFLNNYHYPCSVQGKKKLTWNEKCF